MFKVALYPPGQKSSVSRVHSERELKRTRTQDTVVVLALVGHAAGLGGLGIVGRGLAELLELLGGMVLGLSGGVGVVHRGLVAT